MNVNRTFYAVLAVLCLSFFSLQAQQYQNPAIENFGPPSEINLGAPYSGEGIDLIPSGTDLFDGEDPNTIYYGLAPPNSSNKPVLVFVHGYASNASVWYSGRDNMYNDVYNDGYRTAFVSLTPNKHVWTNGSMLATIIDEVTQHYGVSDVVLVGWSKGGVDTDAAVVHFGGSAKVSQVFTLSTPHNGTYLGELANSWLLSLVNIIFMQNNDATRSLTRGNMAYFRSITDNHPNNTVSFTTIGGWGDGPLNRVDIPQGILHLNGGSRSSGGNDGVVPYSSSLRPGSRELFGGQYKAYGWFGIPYYPGPSQTKLDHFEVTRGGKTWSYIKGVLTGNLRINPQVTPVDYHPNTVTHSNFQLVTSEASANSFIVEKGTESVTLQNLASEGYGWEAQNTAGNTYLAKALSDGSWEFPNLAPGRYTLSNTGHFAALISTNTQIEAHLHTSSRQGNSVYQEGEAMQFKLELTGADAETLENLAVTGLLQRTNTLQMETVDEAPLVVQFEREGDEFLAQTSAHLPGGAYSLTVRAEGKKLARTTVTSVAKLGAESSYSDLGNAFNLEVGPNPFSRILHIHIQAETPAQITIYNMVGQPVFQSAYLPEGGPKTLDWNAREAGHPAGVYIVELSDGQQKQTKKVIMN